MFCHKLSTAGKKLQHTKVKNVQVLVALSNTFYKQFCVVHVLNYHIVENRFDNSQFLPIQICC